MIINPRTLSDAELTRMAYSELSKGLNKAWQEELIKRLEQRVAEPLHS